jgi:hypothetical protein
MKKQRKILLFVFSFLAVFFSFSNDADTKCIQYNIIDNQYITCNEGDNDNSCIDYIDEDQVCLSYNTVFVENPVCQISPPRNNSGVFDFGLSLWQPPKIF